MRPVIQMQLPGGTGCSTARRLPFTAPDSISGQHATWRERNLTTAAAPEDRLADYPLASHVPQDDHKGFTYQDPGVLGHVNKKASMVAGALPPAAGPWAVPAPQALREHRRRGEHAPSQRRTTDEAAGHCTEGTGNWDWDWDWAKHRQGTGPGAVMACRGDTPALEILAAALSLMARAPPMRRSPGRHAGARRAQAT